MMSILNLKLEEPRLLIVTAGAAVDDPAPIAGVPNRLLILHRESVTKRIRQRLQATTGSPGRGW
jgi:hypothetical protein